LIIKIQTLSVAASSNVGMIAKELSITTIHKQLQFPYSVVMILKEKVIAGV